MESNKKLMTQRGIAAALGVCVATVRRWKGCPRVAISARRYRYDADAVRAWLEKRTEDRKGVTV